MEGKVWNSIKILGAFRENLRRLTVKEDAIMKDGYYLSTYLFINQLAYLADIDLRHDMNLSLWKKEKENITLLRYWELERFTGLKQHRRAFYDTRHAKLVINELLKPLGLSLDDMVEVWGTPQLQTNNTYHSINDYRDFSYHSVF